MYSVQASGRKRRRIGYGDYTVAFLVPMAVELVPIRAMLDEIHDDLPTRSYQNAYILGRLGHHNVVTAVLPRTGNNDSAAVATQLKDDFPSIRFAFLIGIAGGIPGVEGVSDIRLGDVVVSEPTGTWGGVIQFDRGRHRSGNKFEITGHLNNPPQILLAALQKMRAEHRQTGNHLEQHITDVLQRDPILLSDYQRPKAESDKLFFSDYEHIEGAECSSCDLSRIRPRTRRLDDQIRTHYGTIGSSNAVIRDAIERDRLRDEYGILCVEMEAAGLMNIMPCLVIRGICDYADSHKSKIWQPYAAAVASAFAKELLHFVAPMENRRALRGDYVDAAEIQQVPETSTLRVLCQSLAFDRMDARLRNIPAALSRTCDWLFQHPHFVDWNDESQQEKHYGFLWIKGKPGCGKSTIMKTAWTHTRQKRHHVVISYFFNARANGQLEKSTFGLYRSLVLQLVQSVPELEHLFLEHFSAKERDGKVEEWSPGELQDFIRCGVLEQRSNPLTIFIDALDEGNDDADVRRMVNFLEELATAATLAEIRFQICLSSRHYPHISIRKGLSFVMEDQHDHMQDIRIYTQTVLNGEHEDSIQEIRERVCAKSAGVFLWVFLVVGMLNKAYDRGQIKEMTQLLDELPEDLDGVYRTILSSNIVESEQCSRLLRWVSYAQHPLSKVELYVVMQGQQGWVDLSSQSIPSNDVLDRYLLDNSRGLTELSESEPRVIQFIHETVRTFLIKNGHEYLSPLVGSKSQHHEGSCHEDLKKSCMEYFRYCLGMLPQIYSNKFNKADGKATKKLTGVIPFAKYAVNNLFKHSDKALEYNIPQNEFLNQFIPVPNAEKDNLNHWIELRNMFEFWRTRKYSQGPPSPLLYVLAEYHCPNLIDVLSRTHVKDVMTNQRFGTALQVACKSGNNIVVEALIRRGSDVNAEGGEYKHALLAAILHKNESTVEILLHSGAKPSKDILEWGLFICISRLNILGVRTILNFGLDVNRFHNSRGEGVLAFALNKNCSMINKSSYSTLENYVRTYDNAEDLEDMRKKSFISSLDVVKLVIEHGAATDRFSCGPNTKMEELPLQYTLRRRNFPAARLLIESGADVNAKCTDGFGLLSDMVRYRSYTGIDFLRAHKANFEASDISRMVQLPKPWQYIDLVSLFHLLGQLNLTVYEFRVIVTSGAEWPDQWYLSRDTSQNASLVNMLLKFGAETKEEDDFRAAALRFAAFHGDSSLVKKLLETGRPADLKARDANNDRALDVALRCRNKPFETKQSSYPWTQKYDIVIAILRQAMARNGM